MPGGGGGRVGNEPKKAHAWGDTEPKSAPPPLWTKGRTDKVKTLHSP